MKRLGIAVSATRLRAVVTRGRRAIWAAERILDAPGELETALGQLAADGMPDVRRARVVLEGDLCRIKVIDGLPRQLRRPALRRAVALHAARWFPRNGATPVTDAVRLERGGPVLAACAPAEAVEAIAHGLAQAGLTLESLRPAATALASLLPDGAHEWRSGDVRHVLDVRRGRPVRVRRTVVASDSGGEPEPPAPPDVALAAALGSSSLDLMPPSLTARCARSRRRLAGRLALAGAALWTLSGVLWFMRLDGALDGARARLRALEPMVTPALRVEADIARAEAALANLEQARAVRSRDVRLLASLTQALPDSIHLVSLRRGWGDTVTVAGFAPSAAQVVRALQPVPGIRDPALAGPVTRERLRDGAPRDRFALRFTWIPEGVP